jgi:hypothetical protein
MVNAGIVNVQNVRPKLADFATIQAIFRISKLRLNIEASSALTMAGPPAARDLSVVSIT